MFVYILKMCTSYYGQILQSFSYIFRMLNLVIFYHCMTLTVPSWCNLKLQVFNQCFAATQVQTWYWSCFLLNVVLVLWNMLCWNINIHYFILRTFQLHFEFLPRRTCLFFCEWYFFCIIWIMWYTFFFYIYDSSIFVFINHNIMLYWSLILKSVHFLHVDGSKYISYMLMSENVFVLC